MNHDWSRGIGSWVCECKVCDCVEPCLHATGYIYPIYRDMKDNVCPLCKFQYKMKILKKYPKKDLTSFHIGI